MRGVTLETPWNPIEDDGMAEAEAEKMKQRAQRLEEGEGER